MKSAFILDSLDRLLEERLDGDPKTSYVASLYHGGIDTLSSKIMEEAAETVEAATTESKDRLASEAADLLFHLMVLLKFRGLSIDAVCDELEQRQGVSGHTEKASRQSVQ